MSALDIQGIITVPHPTELRTPQSRKSQRRQEAEMQIQAMSVLGRLDNINACTEWIVLDSERSVLAAGSASLPII